MSQGTSTCLTSAELSILVHVGENIVRSPKNYKHFIQDNFANPIGSRKVDVLEAEKILDATLGAGTQIFEAAFKLESASNHFCRLLGENIRLSQARQDAR